jgi:hypothetical protein
MLHRYLLLSVIAGALLLWACKKEKSREGTPPPSTCSYAPYKDGAVYNFQQVKDEDTSTFALTVTGDTTVGGKKFKKLHTDTATTYDRCENGTYYQLVRNVTIDDYTADSILSIYLKDAEMLGGTWSDTTKVRKGSEEQDVILKYTIHQKGISKTVLGKDYPDVIVVKVDALVRVLGNWVNFGALAITYYAKDVGMIEIDREKDTTRLVSYDIP